MQAVILAGGEGSRLKDVSDGRPKCLLEVGGRSLIEHQIAALTDNGIHSILVVTGYKAEMVRAVVNSKAEYVENTRYRETNSLYSLWLARAWVKGPFVLMNCDLLFHPDILNRLLRGHGNILTYDSTSTRGLEQTKVAVAGGRVIDLGKDLPAEAARGESLGLLRFDEEGARALFKRAAYLVEHGEEKSWVIEGVRSACSEIAIRALNIAGRPWAEIDFPGDLERARKEVWPAIQHEYWKHVVRWKRTKWVAGFAAVGLLVALGLFISMAIQPPPLALETIRPVDQNREELKLTFPAKNKTQRWWICRKGGPALTFEVEGPETLQVEHRLLMPPGSPMPGRYVMELLLGGDPKDWHVASSEPEPGVVLKDYTVSDKDVIDFEVPPGKHLLQVKLLAGTGEEALVRVRRVQTEEPPKKPDEKN
jgi:choline kinase